jgi:hypothetical protein
VVGGIFEFEFITGLVGCDDDECAWSVT